jgi:Spy/CpxP family protein refolding chaperone
MRNYPTMVILGAAITTAGPAAAQDHAHDHASPYAGFTDREIKALSTEEIDGLLNGDGLGMALPAELHGYPGPKHVLELGTMLDLTPDQRREIEEVFDDMKTVAQSLGKTIIERERELDRAFADGTITEAQLNELVEAIGFDRAKLRAVHLRAHLQVRPILTASQREHYERARGYSMRE